MKGLLLALGSVLVLGGCAPVEEPAVVSTAPSAPTVATNRVYPEPGQQPNAQKFLRDAHANGIDPPGFDDDLLLTVGQATCDAWNGGATYTQTMRVMKDKLVTWSQHDRDAMVIVAAIDLCPKFDGTYGAAPMEAG